MRLVLLGPPGSGKGTQGQKLAERYGVPHVATGDIVRDHIARGTEFGRRVQAAISLGNFAPDEDIIYWVYDRLAQMDAQRGYILDGFPRDLAQAEEFDRHNTRSAVRLESAVELAIPEAALIKRLSGRLVCPVCDAIYHTVFHPPQRPGICDNDGQTLVRRPDDQPEAIQHRLAVYEQATLPLRGYYRQQGILKTIDARGTPDEIEGRIIGALSASQKSGF